MRKTNGRVSTEPRGTPQRGPRLWAGRADGGAASGAGAGGSFGYDGRNRIARASPVSGGTEYYGYAPDNRRLYRMMADGTEQWTLYGTDGRSLATFGLNGTPVSLMTVSVWFAGKLVDTDGFTGSSNTRGQTFQDRLGTDRTGGARFRPFGEEVTATGNSFATYTKDGFSGLNYADQRFYASGYGRFTSPDPYMASGGPSEPGSWNRYAYAGGDPINYNDPSGRARCNVVMVSTTYPDSNDGMTASTTVGMWCYSAGGSQSVYVQSSGPGLDPTSFAKGMEGAVAAAFDANEWATTQTALRRAASQIGGMSFTGKCKDDIYSIIGDNSDNATPAALQKAAGAVVFKNGLTTTDIAGNGTNIQQQFAGEPNRYATALIGGSTVYWRPGWEAFQSIPGMILGGVLHELIHNIGFGDETIQRGLGLDVDLGDTDNITRRLARDCF